MPELNDLTGREIGGVTVLHRAGTSGKVATWRVKHQSCGHEEDVTVGSLAYCEKHNSKRRCKQCAGASATDAPRRKPKSRAAPEPLERIGQTYEFPLRRDYNVNIGLPLDLTLADVKRLSRWLELLVFDDQKESGAG